MAWHVTRNPLPKSKNILFLFDYWHRFKKWTQNSCIIFETVFLFVWSKNLQTRAWPYATTESLDWQIRYLKAEFSLCTDLHFSRYSPKQCKFSLCESVSRSKKGVWKGSVWFQRPNLSQTYFLCIFQTCAKFQGFCVKLETDFLGRFLALK